MSNTPTISFFQHESFYTSARSRIKAKDICASGALQTTTKLSGYIWVGSESKLVHVPEGQAGDVQMDADDDAEGTADELPKLEVKIQQDDQDDQDDAPHEEPQDEHDDDDEPHEEVRDEQMEEAEGVCSQEGEETQEQSGYPEETERPELPELIRLEKNMAITSCLNSERRIFLN